MVRRFVVWIGWGFAVVASGAATYLFIHGQHEQRRATELQARIAEQDRRVAELTAQLQEKTNALAAVGKRVPASNTPIAPPEISGSLIGRLASTLLGGANSKPAVNTKDGKGAGSWLSALAGSISKDDIKEFMSMGVEEAMDEKYKGLFRELQLAPDQEQQMREILARGEKEDMNGIFDMFGEDFSIEKALKGDFGPTDEMARKAGDMMKKDEERKASRRRELAALLTPEQTALYDEYEADLPAHMEAERFDGELTRYAPGLTADNRARAAQVLGEESRIEHEDQSVQAFFPPKAPQDYLAAETQREREQFQRARDRLAQEFPADQLAEFDRFVAKQERNWAMTERMSGLVGQMFSGKEAASKTETVKAAP